LCLAETEPLVCLGYFSVPHDHRDHRDHRVACRVLGLLTCSDPVDGREAF